MLDRVDITFHEQTSIHDARKKGSAEKNQNRLSFDGTTHQSIFLTQHNCNLRQLIFVISSWPIL